MDATHAAPFRVGPWIADPGGSRLIGPGGQRKLRGRDMTVLQVLARHAPGAVELDRIMKEGWGAVIVVPQAVTNAISNLRAAFDDPAAAPRVIAREGRAYRLLAPVQLDGVDLPRESLAAPYRGLEPYRLEDASMFVGRVQVIDEILAALDAQSARGLAFVLLLGASGAGKTSLVQAGVLPRLVHARGTGGGARMCHGLVDCSSEYPARALALAVIHAAASADIDDVDEVETLTDKLLDEPRAAVLALSTRLRAKSARLLLFLDALEGLFRGSVSEADRERFLHVLKTMAACGEIAILAALRSDDFPLIEESAELTVLTRERGQYHLRPPDKSELRSIICQPAALAGVRFETAGDGSSLIEHILDEVELGRDGLPLLSLVLARLYERRTAEGVLTFEAYESLGRLSGCCADHAEHVFASLGAEDQLALPGVMMALARIVDDRPSRRLRPRRDFTTAAQYAVIDAFVEARLFVTAFDGENVTVSVAHDALFRIWPRAVRVIDEYRQQIRAWNNLSAATARWEEADRSDAYCLSPGPLGELASLRRVAGADLSASEKGFVAASERRQRRLQWMRRVGVGALFSMTVVAAAAAFLFYAERRHAQAAQRASEQTTTMMVDMFRWSDPMVALGRRATARDLLDAAFAQTQANRGPALVDAKVSEAMGRAYMNLGEFDRAEVLLTRALDAWTAEQGAQSVDVARSQDVLGKLYYSRGKYEIALERYQRALATFERIGDESESFAQVLNDLGELKAAQAAHAPALEFHGRALAMRKSVLGPSHGRVGESMGNLAGVQRAAGNLKQAEALYREGIAIQTAAYGSKNADVATVTTNLGVLLLESGRLQEARPLLEHALDIRREIFGDEHTYTANSLHNLGALLLRLGDTAAAESVLQKSIATHLRLYGPGHMAVAVGRNSLGMLLQRRGDAKGAADMFRAAVRDFAAVNGERHPNVGTFLTNLAQSLNDQKDYGEAEQAAARAVQILESALAPDHWRLAVARTVRATALSGLGQGFDEEQWLVRPYRNIVAAQGAESEPARQALARARAHFLKAGDERRMALLDVAASGKR